MNKNDKDKDKTVKNTKKNPKNPKKKKLNKLLIILRLFFIILFIVSSSYIIKWVYENRKNSKLNNSLSQYIQVNPADSENITIDFEGLKNENKYFYAWIIVNGTTINYPVVHYTDNDYYLTHSFDNSNNSAGCPFADYRAKCDGTDQNLVIYAHNRKDRKYVCIIKKYIKRKLVFK